MTIGLKEFKADYDWKEAFAYASAITPEEQVRLGLTEAA